MKYKYIAEIREWHDNINGNTYFSANVEDIERDVNYILPFQYGYGDQSEYKIKKILGLFKLKELDKDGFSFIPSQVKFIKKTNCKKKDVVNFGTGDKDNYISRLGYYYQD